MKYSINNKPLVCMQTQSSCYKGTSKMTVKGVLWHSTGANNKTLKRYVQPSDSKSVADTYDKSKWLELLGKNSYNNDWNHTDISAGLNCWIGTLADGTVTTVQTMPWDYKPWGCGKGSKGSCNDGWIQFEICEDALADADYFNRVYKEACEITAYLCKLYNIDPNGKVTVNGIQIPTILCHADSYKLGFGSNHGDVNHWFPKHGKNMSTARADVTALLKESGSVVENNSTAAVKTYKVVAPINRYTTSADAAAQQNAKDEKLAVGTYYIYNKYPDGVNGVYNISTDKTGSSAGSWINPKENVLTESTAAQESQKLYRVRKAKDDVKSQVGAFTDLQNAISACQDAGAGYHVFDWNFDIVYSYEASIDKKPVQENTTAATAVYDLDYTEKIKIVDNTVNRTDIDCVKAIECILVNNPVFDFEIAKVFFKHAKRYSIDPLMAIAQSILETGWFKYENSAVKAEQHNYCGLGVTSNGKTGASFNTIDEGVIAQLQHLYAYGCKDILPVEDTILDPRFNLVTRGIATYWQQLAGRWACPGYDSTTYNTPEAAMKAGNTYGQKIRSIYSQLINTKIEELDVEKYFSSVQEEPIIPTPEQGSDSDEIIPESQLPTVDETPEEDFKYNEEANKNKDLAMLIMDLLDKLVKFIINLFKNKGE